MSDAINRTFKTAGDLLAYLKECCAEEDVIKEAQKRRPLRKGEQMFRRAAVIDGSSFLSSVVIRTDGSIEFWMRHFLVDEDSALQDETHRTFELVAHLRPQEPTED